MSDPANDEPPSRDSAAVVEQWIARGRPTSMIADNFRWVMHESGPSGASAVYEGATGLAALLAVGKARYRGGVQRNTHFLIGEGEWVAWQVDSIGTLLDGQPYRNDYMFTFRVVGDTIAEVYHFADAEGSGFSRPAEEAVPGVLSDEDAARLNPDQRASDPGYFAPHPPRY